MKKNKNEPFLGFKKSLIYVLRSAMLSGEISSKDLEDAWGLSKGTAMEVIAEFLAAFALDDPPDLE